MTCTYVLSFENHSPRTAIYCPTSGGCSVTISSSPHRVQTKNIDMSQQAELHHAPSLEGGIHEKDYGLDGVPPLHLEGGAHGNNMDDETARQDAMTAEQAEHAIPLREALVVYRSAILWSMALSLVIIMDGYDTGCKYGSVIHVRVGALTHSAVQYQRAALVSPEVRSQIRIQLSVVSGLANCHHRSPHRGEHHVCGFSTPHNSCRVLTRKWHLRQLMVPRSLRLQANHSGLSRCPDRFCVYRLLRSQCSSALCWTGKSSFPVLMTVVTDTQLLCGLPWGAFSSVSCFSNLSAPD